MDKLVQQINRIISKIAKGDIKALDELFALTSRMLFLMAKKYLYDKSYAEDLVSEIYLTVAKKASTFDKTKNGLNWLYKITHNAAINYNLKDKSYLHIELNEQIGRATSHEVENWMDTILIDGALNQLTAEEKQLIHLRYWEGLTLQEIAERLNLPMTTTHDRMKRVLKKLKKLL